MVEVKQGPIALHRQVLYWAVSENGQLASDQNRTFKAQRMAFLYDVLLVTLIHLTFSHSILGRIGKIM